MTELHTAMDNLSTAIMEAEPIPTLIRWDRNGAVRIACVIGIALCLVGEWMMR